MCTLYKTYFFLAYYSNVLTTAHKNPPQHNIYDTRSWYWLDGDQPRINVCLYSRMHKKQLTPQPYTAVNPQNMWRWYGSSKHNTWKLCCIFFSIYMLPTSVNMVACDWKESPHPYQKETVYKYFQSEHGKNYVMQTKKVLRNQQNSDNLITGI